MLTVANDTCRNFNVDPLNDINLDSVVLESNTCYNGTMMNNLKVLDLPHMLCVLGSNYYGHRFLFNGIKNHIKLL